MFSNLPVGFNSLRYSKHDPLLFVLDAKGQQQALRIVVNGNPCDPVEPEQVKHIFDEALKMELVPISIAQNKDYYGFEEIYPKYKVVRQLNPYILEAIM